MSRSSNSFANRSVAPNGTTLESDSLTKPMYPASKTDTKRYADQCRSMFGTAAMPPVLYKGKVLKEGLLGTRNLNLSA